MSIDQASFGALSGPYLPSINRFPSALVIVLHGYGANGMDLFSLAQPLVDALGMKDLAVWAPDAPDPLMPVEGSFVPVEARQWFPIRSLEHDELSTGVSYAGPIARTAISAAMQSLSIKPDNLVVIGFSQGGMVALNACLGMEDPIAHIIGLSTAYVADKQSNGTPSPSPILSKPPVTLVHGDADPVVPPASLMLAEEDLKLAGIECDAHMLVGLQHSIDARVFDIVIGAARRAFGLDRCSQ